MNGYFFQSAPAVPRKRNKPTRAWPLPAVPIERWLLFCTIFGYLLLCCVLFVFYVRPSFLGGNNLRIGADSATYLSAAGFTGSSRTSEIQNIPLVTAGGNFLGPVAIAILARSLWGIALFDIIVFLVGLRMASHLPNVRLGPFFFLMVLNPMLTPALLTLNKEILVFIATILFVRYIFLEDKSKFQLFVLLAVSLLARWEQAAVTGAVLALSNRHSPLKSRPKLTIALIIIAITLTYPVVVRTRILDLSNMIAFAAEGSTGPFLNNIQAFYGFPVVLIPKIAINLFGHLLSPRLFFSDFFTNDPTDFQIYFALPLHCLAMFFVLVAVAIKRKIKLQNPTIYWCAIYLVVTAVSPILQPRYQFPIYVLLCLELSGLRNPLELSNRVEPQLQGALSAGIATN